MLQSRCSWGVGGRSQGQLAVDVRVEVGRHCAGSVGHATQRMAQPAVQQHAAGQAQVRALCASRVWGWAGAGSSHCSLPVALRPLLGSIRGSGSGSQGSQGCLHSLHGARQRCSGARQGGQGALCSSSGHVLRQPRQAGRGPPAAQEV